MRAPPAATAPTSSTGAGQLDFGRVASRTSRAWPPGSRRARPLRVATTVTGGGAAASLTASALTVLALTPPTGRMLSPLGLAVEPLILPVPSRRVTGLIIASLASTREGPPEQDQRVEQVEPGT